MTIEIRELVIEARVGHDNAHATARSGTGHGDVLQSMSRMERERLIAMITRRVLENLKDQQGGRGNGNAR